MVISITYEGFTVTFKQIFLFTLITPVFLWFVICLLGPSAAQFIRGLRSSSTTETVSSGLKSEPESPEYFRVDPPVSDEQRGFYGDFDD